MTRTLRCAIVGTGAIAHFHARGHRGPPRGRTRRRDRPRPRARRFLRGSSGETPPSTTRSRSCSRRSIPTSSTSARRPSRTATRRSRRSPRARTSSSRSLRRRRSTSSTTCARPPKRPAGSSPSSSSSAPARPPRTCAGCCARARSGVRSSRCARRSGTAIEAYFAVPWRGKWETEGGGTTLGHGIHQLDLLAFLLGDWASVQGRLWRLDRETQTEDASTATVEFANGVVAQVVTSAVSPRETSSIRIDTQKATVTVDHLYGHGHENWRITPAPRFRGARRTAWAFPDARGAQRPRAAAARCLRRSARGGAAAPTADAPARSFEIVAAIYASAAADGAVVTPADLARIRPIGRLREPRRRPPREPDSLRLTPVNRPDRN